MKKFNWEKAIEDYKKTRPWDDVYETSCNVVEVFHADSFAEWLAEEILDEGYAEIEAKTEGIKAYQHIIQRINLFLEEE